MRFRTIAVVLGLMAALAACDSVTAGETTSDLKGSNAATTAAPVKAGRVGKARTTSVARQDGTIPFGKMWRYEDGVGVSVGQPKRADCPSWAEDEIKGRTCVRFKIKILNGTSVIFDPGMALVTAQSGDTEAESFGLDSPTTKVLPGRQTTWKEVFAVDVAGDLVVEVTPGAGTYSGKLWR